MSFNASGPMGGNGVMNAMIRSRGNRSRTRPVPQPAPGSLPNIGQTPAVQISNALDRGGVSSPGFLPGSQGNGGGFSAGVPGQMPGMPPQPQPQPVPQPAPAQTLPASPYGAPPQPLPMSMSGVGMQADPNHYNYEPLPDGSWKVYPPGVAAPPQVMQASLPRAASTADYRRLAGAFQPVPQPQPAPQQPSPQPQPYPQY